MVNCLIFQFLYTHVLNCCYFHTDCSTFFKNKKNVGKIKKTFITTMFFFLFVEKMGGDGPGGGIRHDNALQQDCVSAGKRTSTKQRRAQVETAG